jgi:hypothetical protein
MSVVERTNPRFMAYTASAMWGAAWLDGLLEGVLPNDPPFAVAPSAPAAIARCPGWPASSGALPPDCLEYRAERFWTPAGLVRIEEARHERHSYACGIPAATTRGEGRA